MSFNSKNFLADKRKQQIKSFFFLRRMGKKPDAGDACLCGHEFDNCLWRKGPLPSFAFEYAFMFVVSPRKTTTKNETK
ncbi:hypothetical protein B6A27_09010 [Anoxybacillus sp. UARK-01]|nr:hypothetical protein B6A27_09010 [Anoxybacillus sp. UARK-01]